MSSPHDMVIAPALRADAERIANEAMFRFRQSIASDTSPILKLLAAKALLSQVRTMVEDLEQGV